MKINKKLFVLSLSLATLSLPLVAISCGVGSGSTASTYKLVSSPEQPAKAVSEKISDGSIVITVTDPENQRWVETKKQLVAYSKTNGFEHISSNHVKAQAEQNSFVDAELAKTGNNKPKVVLMGAADSGNATQAIESTTNAQAQFIAVDRFIHKISNNYNWYVAFNNYTVGQLQGLALISGIYGKQGEPFKTLEEAKTYVMANKLASEKGFVALAGAPEDNNSHLFFKGAMDVITAIMKIDSNLKYFGEGEGADVFNRLSGDSKPTDQELTSAITSHFGVVAQANWNYSQGKQFLDTLFAKSTFDSRKNNLAAVLAPNDEMAQQAAITSIEQKGLDPKKIYITGQDSNQPSLRSIDNETGQNMTISKEDWKIAAISTALAYYIVKNPKQSSETDEVYNKKVEAYLKKQYSNIPFQISRTEYVAKESESNKKEINSVLLTPTLVTKANFSKVFKKES
ncbi:sugar ABC transporter substrate-binding protein [Mycoplasmopsis pulmonis]|uniref:sugar ABC transporter substrate-binding protein n=1 Tax=Mycoplasmopsis pulmonis TaxID=2107 RepID=UPI002ACE3AC2|nr:sugar ABC transporter substrate-binding protein [Mycoplasmopsis pulmonis]MDZ7293301.1 sugar ABC transporter substrate-binding protein [Mycoplasmopsis pulmonis]